METFEDLLKRIVTEAVRDALRLEFGRSTPTTEAPYLSIRDAATLVGVSRATIRGWTQEGLRGYGTGNNLRVRSDELHEFVASAKPKRATQTPEQQADEWIRQFRVRNAQRCVRCHHLPSMHVTGRGCRAKKCTCEALVPPTSPKRSV
jgi:excisionase family DNA binding protein